MWRRVTAGWPWAGGPGTEAGPAWWTTAPGTSSSMRENVCPTCLPPPPLPPSEGRFLPKDRWRQHGWSGRLGVRYFLMDYHNSKSKRNRAHEPAAAWVNWKVFIWSTLWDEWFCEQAGNLTITHEIISIFKWILFSEQPKYKQKW